MSVQAFSWVLEYSEAQGLERLVLQSHANNARGHEPPWRSWTGIDTVVHESRATRRGVQKATQRLVAKKRLLPTGEKRGAGTLVYEIAVDAEADRVDREVRLKREELERKRSRRGANSVRPSDSDDPVDPGGEQDSPPTDEQRSPSEGEPSSPQGANFETPGGELEDACAEQSSPKPSVTAEPAAAKAAAASANAPDGSRDAAGSSSRPASGAVRRFWGPVTTYLVALGFDVAAIEEYRLRLEVQIRRRAQDLAIVDWPALTAKAVAARRLPTDDPGRMFSPQPLGALNWGLNQQGHDTKTTGRPAPGKAANSGPTTQRLELPDPPDDVRVSWQELLEGMTEHPGWADTRGQFDQWLPLIVPLRIVEGTLEVTAQPHPESYIEATPLVKWLDVYAAKHLNGHVRWVPSAEAAA